MKLKWIWAIITVESLALLYILYLLGLMDLKVGITTGLVEMSVAALFWWLDRRRNKQEEESRQKEKLEQEKAKKQEKKEKDKLTYLEKLVDKELKPITNTYIDLCDKSGNICIKGMKSSEYAYENYAKELNKLLENEYPDIWKHKAHCDTFIKDYNALSTSFLDNTKEKMLNEIKLKVPLIVEWDGDENGQIPMKYFNTKYISLNVLGVIIYSYNQMFDVDTNCSIIQDKGKWKVIIDYKVNTDIMFRAPMCRTLFYDFFGFVNKTSIAESDNESEMIQVKDIVVSTLRNALTTDNLSKLKEYKKDAVTEYNLFLNGINDIIKNVDLKRQSC